MNLEPAPVSRRPRSSCTERSKFTNRAMHASSRARRGSLEAPGEMALVCTQVLVAQVRGGQRVAVGGEERQELAELGLISANRVRAAVRLELKPADVFRRGGLQVVGHIEAVCML